MTEDGEMQTGDQPTFDTLRGFRYASRTEDGEMQTDDGEPETGSMFYILSATKSL